MEDDFSKFHTGNFLPFHIHSVLKIFHSVLNFSSVFHFILPHQNCFRMEATQPVADPENFGGGGFEAQNLKNSDVFTKIENDFSAEVGNSTVFFAQIQVVSKKKKVFTKIETDFSPDSLRLGRWGGMHPEMEPNYSKQRLIFRPKSLLLGWWGGCIPPLNPPLNATHNL